MPYISCKINRSVNILNKKGITLVEILVSIVIIAVTLLSIFVFSTKIKNKTAVENNMIDIFYNNVSAHEILQKELNKTGDIDIAVKKAIKETQGVSGKYIKTLIVKINPIVIYPDWVDISEVETNIEPIYKGGEKPAYYKQIREDSDGNDDGYIYYYNSGVVSPNFNLSQNIPIYKVTINTKLGTQIWDNLAVTSLVCQNGGIGTYHEK